MNKFRNLRIDEIEVRVDSISRKGCSLRLYKDARCDMNILDETVGPENWQRSHLRDNANCAVSIYDASKGEWISKEDTGTKSNYEAEKGLASDSFKRACVNWGIGRELYTSPFIWISSENVEIETNSKGKLVAKDKFKIGSISIENGVITALTIINTGQYGKGNKEVFRYKLGVFENEPEVSSQNKKSAQINDVVDNGYATSKDMEELRFILKQYSAKSGDAVTLSNVLKDYGCTVDKFKVSDLREATNEWKKKLDIISTPIDEYKINTLRTTLQKYNRIFNKKVSEQEVAAKYGFKSIEQFTLVDFRKCMNVLQESMKRVNKDAQ